MVIARDEDTGQSGIFPVSAVMIGETTALRWLTLADENGETSRLGLTGGQVTEISGSNSFAPGTEILTPEGKVAIEALREGDMVIARNEETGVSGVFPVTALMSRQATDTIWITVEDAHGQMTRMGVTSEHPLFVIDEGWLDASQVAPGDQIRNSNLQALTVLSMDVDTRPQIVHNLEIADAHTYFAGELEAWGHNRGLGGNPFKGKKFHEIAQRFRDKGFVKCSTRKGKGGVPLELFNPRTGFRYFLDGSGFEQDIGDHVDVIRPRGRSKKKRLPL
ncbi:MAG: polymorphic toxin-type HINT domain-containing protein [Paracoccaceae bacterium]